MGDVVHPNEGGIGNITFGQEDLPNMCSQTTVKKEMVMGVHLTVTKKAYEGVRVQMKPILCTKSAFNCHPKDKTSFRDRHGEPNQSMPYDGGVPSPKGLPGGGAN